MAKLNWANNNGSISVIIPKNMIEQLDWKCGDDVVLFVRDNKLIIQNLKDLSDDR